MRYAKPATRGFLFIQSSITKSRQPGINHADFSCTAHALNRLFIKRHARELPLIHSQLGGGAGAPIPECSGPLNCPLRVQKNKIQIRSENRRLSAARNKWALHVAVYFVQFIGAIF